MRIERTTSNEKEVEWIWTVPTPQDRFLHWCRTRLKESLIWELEGTTICRPRWSFW